MFPVSRRIVALASIIPAVSLALAACGSPAINTNYTPGAQPTAGSTMSGGPTMGTTSTASKPARTGGAASAGSHTTKPAASGSHSTAPAGSRSSSGGSGGTHTVAPSSATITVTPSTGLASGQVVTIRGSHFNPRIKVIAVQCINKGSNTQASNCNINLFALPKGFYPAANGTFTVTLRVKKTFGSNTCGASGQCIVSVSEPNNNPIEEADANIYFR